MKSNTKTLGQQIDSLRGSVIAYNGAPGDYFDFCNTRARILYRKNNPEKGCAYFAKLTINWAHRKGERDEVIDSLRYDHDSIFSVY